MWFKTRPSIFFFTLKSKHVLSFWISLRIFNFGFLQTYKWTVAVLFIGPEIQWSRSIWPQCAHVVWIRYFFSLFQNLSTLCPHNISLYWWQTKNIPKFRIYINAYNINHTSFRCVRSTCVKSFCTTKSRKYIVPESLAQAREKFSKKIRPRYGRDDRVEKCMILGRLYFFVFVFFIFIFKLTFFRFSLLALEITLIYNLISLR